MAKSIVLTPGGSGFTLQDSSQMCALERLAALMGLPFPVETPPVLPNWVEIMAGSQYVRQNGDVEFLSRRNRRVIWCGGEKRLLILLPQPQNYEIFHLKTIIFIWQWLIAGISLVSLMRGCPLISVHGVLLETAKGGVLLCGESGIGKSTTARRWQDAGGLAPADDLVLLSLASGEKITACPLPTWSRCQEGIDGLVYPVGKELALTGVLALDRAAAEQPENIAPLKPEYFTSQLYRSLFFPILPAVRSFPVDGQIALREAVWHAVNEISRRYPPRILSAGLDGDLRQTLREY